MATKQESERQRQAKRDLGKKIQLESLIKPKLNTFFRIVARDAKTNFLENGTLNLSLNPFIPEMEAILSAHYKRVNNAFSRTIVNDLKCHRDIVITKQDQERIDIEDQRFTEDRADENSRLIVNTTSDQLIQSYDDAERLLTESGEPFGVDDQALLATSLFLSRSASRPDTIALTETQAPAENSKNNQIARLTLIGIATAESLKIWTTILDDKARDAHLDADGQGQPPLGNFIVAGEDLKYPGDTSQGASAGNVINCRCSTSLSL